MAALKEDIILVLHQDRREHVFMNYAYNFDRLPVDEQKALALFVSSQMTVTVFVHHNQNQPSLIFFLRISRPGMQFIRKPQ